MQTPVALEAWKIDSEAFPDTGSDYEKLRFAVGYALLAPSSHNSQPWRFEIEQDTLRLYADRSRTLAVADPTHRELIISCGAALGHLLAALRGLGETPEPSILPDAGHPDLLAIVRLGKRRPPTDAEVRLLEAMPRRRTFRGHFSAEPIGEQVYDRLSACARNENALLVPVREEQRPRIADLVADAERRQMGDPAYRSELSRWMRPNQSPAFDGIPGYAFGFGNLASMLAPRFLRRVNAGNQAARRDRALLQEAPVVTCLLTPHDDVAAWLDCGRALSAVLLSAAVQGIAAGYLNQPIEVTALRGELRRLLETDAWPQLLLRMGHAPLSRPTPRRPQAEVVHEK